MATLGGWQFAIDVGGTFTDCIAIRPDGKVLTHKLLSTGQYVGTIGAGSSSRTIRDAARRGDPPGFFDGWTLSIREAGGAETSAIVARFEPGTGSLHLCAPLADSALRPGGGYELRPSVPAPLLGIRYLLGLAAGAAVDGVAVRLGTTRGTNALLERRGAKVALLLTDGFGDLLRIGHQARPRLFDLNIRKPAPIYCESMEVRERVGADGRVLRPLDEHALRRQLIEARQRGIESLAVCLMNSYCNAEHELIVERIAREVGFAFVSVSSRLSPLPRIVARAETTVVDAYIAPLLNEYVADLRSGMRNSTLHLMTSAGTLSRAEAFVARDSVLSGPAGGAVGVDAVARSAQLGPCIGLDMGGTSTDVCRVANGVERRVEMTLEDRGSGGQMRIVAPMLAIETVAAGGGSLCGFDGVKPTVGPRSAGADPGPACYGRGGPLCLTDANLLLGRIAEAHFSLPLDVAAAERRMDEMIAEVQRATGRRYGREELAAGYIAIANAQLASAVREVTLRRGHDPREHALVPFGGAGGQHACALARELGMRKIVHHPLAGLLSALGIARTSIARHAARAVGATLSGETLDRCNALASALEAELRASLSEDDAVAAEQLCATMSLEMRYAGQDEALDVSQPGDGDWRGAFEQRHRALYGFTLSGRAIEVVTVRQSVSSSLAPALIDQPPARRVAAPANRCVRVFFGGEWRSADLWVRSELAIGQTIGGPALICEPTSTLFVEPGWEGAVAADGVIVLHECGASADVAGVPAVHAAGGERGGRGADPIALELFHHHFSSIADAMGTTLRRTALSTNVKERLDFSCAVFDAAGNLVAHAPHIPVHLGAMSLCVQCLIEDLAPSGGVRPNEVYVTNNPFRGGSHLPDITVISPVYDEQRDVAFYVASRAHHAEIGGSAPGSMPADSVLLDEEGVRIDVLRMPLASVGGEPMEFDDSAFARLLAEGRHPSRAIDQNLADLHAQVAANHQGSSALRALARRYGRATVQFYMQSIQAAAEAKTRRALQRLLPGTRRFADMLDDGTAIVVTLSLDRGAATFDFSECGPTHAGNLNATPAIVTSAVLYCLRCLIDEDVPLNSGILAPVRIVTRPGSVLHPGRRACGSWPAVVGGNVETSQRIVDVILGAFGIVAASQGTMNNFTFGVARATDDVLRGGSYYETICGGSGAGRSFDGADAVHTHMTNTRLTDPEVLEARYPVRLVRFAIRRGSGGAGLHPGGAGVVRQLEFLAPAEASLLTQRRVYRPYGLEGGEAGAAGRNTLIRADGARIDLGPAARVALSIGDQIIIETPGGGGWGSARA